MDNKNLSLSGLKVLVVDDEEDALALTQLMLELCDAEVITSPTAAEGLEQVQMQRPNVIISDIRMPHMDGYQFIQAVRKLPLHKGKWHSSRGLHHFHPSPGPGKSVRCRFPGISFQTGLI